MTFANCFCFNQIHGVHFVHLFSGKRNMYTTITMFYYYDPLLKKHEILRKYTRSLS